MFGYFFSSNPKVTVPVVEDVKKSSYIIKKQQRKNKTSFINPTKKNGVVFLVSTKGSMTPLGVYDTLEEAKSEGTKITCHDCIIIPFKINEKCKYMYNPVYESK